MSGEARSNVRNTVRDQQLQKMIDHADELRAAGASPDEIAELLQTRSTAHAAVTPIIHMIVRR